jgi:hypothetical protein
MVLESDGYGVTDLANGALVVGVGGQLNRREGEDP